MKKLKKTLLVQLDRNRSHGNPINGSMVQEMAREEAQRILEHAEYTEATKAKYRNAIFGPCWLAAFKKRYQLRKIRISGEGASVPADYEERMRTVQDTIRMANLPPARIYNFDESAFFYRAFPNYTLARATDRGIGGKKDKSRVSVLFMTNGDGSHRQLVVIGKSKTPQGLDADFLSTHGIQYYHNGKAWMTRDLFTKIVKDFDASLSSPVLVILDNFAGHILEEADVAALRYVSFVYLPSNTTAKTQPLDGGIIAATKSKYRTLLLRFAVRRMAENSFRANDVTLKHAITWIDEAFGQIKQETILKGFSKTLQLPQLFSVVSLGAEELQDTDELRQALEAYFGEAVTEEAAQDYAMLEEQADQLISSGKLDDNDNNSDKDVVDDEETTMEDLTRLCIYVDRLIKYFDHKSRRDAIRALHEIKESIMADAAALES